MALPNFLIIGAMKGGTTSLDRYLAQHPDIFMTPVPEPNFFAFEGRRMDFRGPGGTEAPINRTSITERRAYEKLFEGARGEPVLGETSPVYLYVEGTAERIHRNCPEIKLVAILRNPVARAYSAYQHLLREGREPLDFLAALDAEPQRIRESWGFLWRYVDAGRYASQLRRFLDVFPSNQLRVYLFDHFATDPAGVCRDIFEFLAVDPSFEPDTSVQYNVSGVPRGRFLHRLLNPSPTVRRAVWRATPGPLRERARAAHASIMSRTLQKEALPADGQNRLVRDLRDEIKDLEALIGQPVGHWLATQA